LISFPGLIDADHDKTVATRIDLAQLEHVPDRAQSSPKKVRSAPLRRFREFEVPVEWI
jgi:hypothetical protein